MFLKNFKWAVSSILQNSTRKAFPSLSPIIAVNNHPRYFTSEKIFPEAKDFLPLEGTDFTEIYCSNAKQSAFYYNKIFGFNIKAYCGLETGNKEKASYVLSQGDITLVLSCPYSQNGEIAEHVKKHGDAVHKVALRVFDASSSFYETTSRGAKAYLEPKKLFDEDGEAVISGIHAYGDTIHLFVERKNYNGVFLPGYKPYTNNIYNNNNNNNTGLLKIDHIVANVGWNQMNVWSNFYHNVFGMTDLISFDDKDISTEYTALMSKVVTNGTGYVKFPINEPAIGKKKSQIEEYLLFNEGEGVQHLALSTNNILKTVHTIKENGGEFLTVPSSYYEEVLNRCGQIDEQIHLLKKYNILVDRDEHGYMLQIFTKPLTDRPTLFFEIIQRKGAQSFGKGNFKALFESIELEQKLRKTL